MKLKAIQLFSDPTDSREIRSYEEVSKLSDYGIPYINVTNAVYKGEIPVPREAPDRPFVLTPSHYGCYKAHKDAFFEYSVDDIDGLLLFECDAVFVLPIEEMVQRISRAYEACIEDDLMAFTFGPKHDSKILDKNKDVIVISQFIETHAYLIPQPSFEYFRDLFSRPWDALDYVYTVYMYDRDRKRIGTFADRVVCVQADGKSLITGKTKESETHWKYRLYD